MLTQAHSLNRCSLALHIFLITKGFHNPLFSTIKILQVNMILRPVTFNICVTIICKVTLSNSLKVPNPYSVCFMKLLHCGYFGYFPNLFLADKRAPFPLHQAFMCGMVSTHCEKRLSFMPLTHVYTLPVTVRKATIWYASCFLDTRNHDGVQPLDNLYICFHFYHIWQQRIKRSFPCGTSAVITGFRVKQICWCSH